jgi:hypothetical protein
MPWLDVSRARVRFPQRNGMGDLEWPIRLSPDQRDGRERELHGLPRGLECLQEMLPATW